MGVTAMDNLTWLTEWFAKQCDGEWESDFGVSIETVNNPGWMVKVDLDGTGLDPSSFQSIASQRTPSNWIECKVEDGAWMGGAGMSNLDEVIGIFRAWVEGSKRPAMKSARPRMGGGGDGGGGGGRGPSGPPRQGGGGGGGGGGGFKPWGKPRGPRR